MITNTNRSPDQFNGVLGQFRLAKHVGDQLAFFDLVTDSNQELQSTNEELHSVNEELYTVNAEDVYPILGPTAIEGFVVANGFSGHGFKEAPMVGSLIAQWLTGSRASYDTDVPLSFLAIDRDPIPMASGGVLA